MDPGTAVAIYIGFFVSLVIVVAITTFYCMCKKKVKKGRVVRPPQPEIVVTNSSSPAAADVITRYDGSVSNNDVYIVPFSALPPNFDYSARGVEVRGDFVVLKNLSLLNSNPNYEIYRQAPYNPNMPNAFNQNPHQYNSALPPPYTPHMYPTVTGEAYQKQASYNPGYIE